MRQQVRTIEFRGCFRYNTPNIIIIPKLYNLGICYVKGLGSIPVQKRDSKNSISPLLFENVIPNLAVKQVQGQ
jgi:hypothetical protein